MERARSVFAALRGFARGFLGLRQPPAAGREALRQQLQRDERRPRCC